MEIWGQISAGKGPLECCWVVYRTTREMKEEAESLGLTYNIIYEELGEEKDTMKSVLFSVSGQRVHDFMTTWAGSIKWIGKSLFRPHHKRKNWFIGVEFYPPVSETRWDKKDIKIEFFRGSGPGGQHRNKVETGVRLEHLATGIVINTCEERSQAQNKKLAFAKLAYALDTLNENNKQQNKNTMWQQHQNLERGNAIRTYKDAKFTKT